MRGGRICTYVSSIKGTPRTVLLSALPIFPYAHDLINHSPLVRRQPCRALRRIVFVMVVAMMRMRFFSFMGVVYVYLLRPLVLVVEIDDRFQVFALDMSVHASTRHRLHEGFAVSLVLRDKFNIANSEQRMVLASVRVLGITILVDAPPAARASAAQSSTPCGSSSRMRGELTSMALYASLKSRIR